MAESVVKPSRYCRRCWYVLDGLTERRCPECGREFDPAKPRSYRTRPRGRFWLTRLLKLATVMLVLIAVGGGWYYWRYSAAQRAHTRLTALGVLTMSDGPIGPPWLCRWMSRQNLPVIRPVNALIISIPLTEEDLSGLPDVEHVGYLIQAGSDAELAGLKRLSKLRRLSFSTRSGKSPMTDNGLVHLKSCDRLEDVQLMLTRVTDSGLAQLKDLPALRVLALSGQQATPLGISHLESIPKLRHLCLYGQDVTDLTVERLKVLVGLNGLCLHATKVGDEGLKHLAEMPNLAWLNLGGSGPGGEGQWSLKDPGVVGRAEVTRTSVSEDAVAELKQALPNLTVSLDSFFPPCRNCGRKPRHRTGTRCRECEAEL